MEAQSFLRKTIDTCWRGLVSFTIGLLLAALGGLVVGYVKPLHACWTALPPVFQVGAVLGALAVGSGAGLWLRKRFFAAPPRKEGWLNMRRVMRQLHRSPRRHPVLFLAVSQVLWDLVRNLFVDQDQLFLGEYLRMLRCGLASCPSFFFATCLLTPSEWYNGGYKQSIREYFDLQCRLKKDHPKCEMFRVLVMPSDRLDDPELGRWVHDHVSKGIYVGFYASEQLALMQTEYVKDFAMFVDRWGAWVVEAGASLTVGEEGLVQVKVRDGSDVHGYSKLIETLEHGKWPTAVDSSCVHQSFLLTSGEGKKALQEMAGLLKRCQ